MTEVSSIIIIKRAGSCDPVGVPGSCGVREGTSVVHRLDSAQSGSFPPSSTRPYRPGNSPPSGTLRVSSPPHTPTGSVLEKREVSIGQT